MWSFLSGLASLVTIGAACTPSVTTASGPFAPDTICSGDLIFSEEFNHLDSQIWEHELGIVNGMEFQHYVDDRKNSFTEDGILYIRPSVAPDELYNEIYSISTGEDMPINRETRIQNPIKSARIRTQQSFRFRYGRTEVRAKMPAGDWLFPAIWMNPAFRVYGTWPQSGEIDIVESRGNRDLYQNGVNIGTREGASTLNFGPNRQLNAWRLAHWTTRNVSGFDAAFHRYQLEWTSDYLKFSIDDVEIGRATPPAGGFFEFGNFSAYDVDNLWQNGTKMAPFDQEFYFILNVAVGTTSGYFPDDASNPVPKPWRNTSPTAAEDFWDGRSGWLPTWNLHVNGGKGAALQVDYVRVWAL